MFPEHIHPPEPIEPADVDSDGSISWANTFGRIVAC
jgi:hypothetical protein